MNLPMCEIIFLYHTTRYIDTFIYSLNIIRIDHSPMIGIEFPFITACAGTFFLARWMNHRVKMGCRCLPNIFCIIITDLFKIDKETKRTHKNVFKMVIYLMYDIVENTIQFPKLLKNTYS